MPQQTPGQWEKIRERYELGEVVQGLAKEFSISYEAIRKRAVRDKWLNPRKVARRAREKMVARNEEIIEAEEDRMMKRFVEAKEHLSAAGLHAIRRFREDIEAGHAPAVSDWNAVLDVVTALEKAIGVEESPEKPGSTSGWISRF